MDHAVDRMRHKSAKRTIISLVLLGLGSFFLYKTITKPPPIISPVPEETPPARSLFVLSRPKDPDTLEAQIRKLVDDVWQNYSVLLEDYTSDFSVGINEQVIFTGASINKLPILASLYHLAQNGKIDLDRVITLQKEDIQDYGTGSIRYYPPRTTYSVKTLARLMIQKSDNTAAYILAQHIIGLDKIQGLIQEWGLTQTDMVNNKTSNKDVAILFRKLYSGNLVNQALTSEMLSYLKDTDFDTRLPSLLPKGTTIYHKIGTEVRFIHDAGIVTDGKRTYYLGVFTSDVTNEEATDKLIAQISELVYNYLR